MSTFLWMTTFWVLAAIAGALAVGRMLRWASASDVFRDPLPGRGGPPLRWPEVVVGVALLGGVGTIAGTAAFKPPPPPPPPVALEQSRATKAVRLAATKRPARSAAVTLTADVRRPPAERRARRPHHRH